MVTVWDAGPTATDTAATVQAYAYAGWRAEITM